MIHTVLDFIIGKVRTIGTYIIISKSSRNCTDEFMPKRLKAEAQHYSAVSVHTPWYTMLGSDKRESS